MIATQLALRLCRSDRRNHHGVAAQRSLYGHVRGGVLIEIFLVPLQLIHFVADNERITGLLRTRTRTVCLAHVLHLVRSAARDVAHLPGQGRLLALWGGSREGDQGENGSYHYGPEGLHSALL